MKRLFVAALWAYAFWYLGAFVALTMGISDLFGLILGTSAGVLILVDPRRVVFRATMPRIALPVSRSAGDPA